MPSISEIRQKYPQYQDMSDQQLADSLHQKFYSDLPRDEFYQRVGFSTEPDPRDSVLGKVDAAVRGAADMMSLGFADEIAAGLGTGFGLLGDYDKELARQRGIDTADAENRGGYRLGGQLAGGLTGGAGLAKSGLSAVTNAAGRGASLGRLAMVSGAEGAGYGAAHGFGSGEGLPNRLENAGWGGALGAGVGMAAPYAVAGASKALGSLTGSARKAAEATGPSVNDLAAQANKLYRASEAEGVRFGEDAIKGLRNNLKFAAGSPNEKLRPLTAGTLDEIEKRLSGPVSLEAFDEFRQGLGMDIRAAKGQDKMFLTRMQKILDSFADNVAQKDITGGSKGIPLLKEARKQWAATKKAEVIDDILDMAGVKEGQYTQSGLANAIKSEMRPLYRSIVNGKSGNPWTKEETALIRQMAKGGSSSNVVNLLAKFAPRGVVSILGGGAVGSMIPGVGTVGVPLAGHLAGRAADTAALKAAQTLRSAAVSGTAPMSRAPTQLSAQQGLMAEILNQYGAAAAPRILGQEKRAPLEITIGGRR